MEGFALNLSNQQRGLFTHTIDACDTVVEGDIVIMSFFHGGYFEGVLIEQDNVEDDDNIGLGFSVDNESYCSAYMADRVVYKSDFKKVLDDASVSYPNIASEIKKPTEEDANQIKINMALSITQAIRHAGHDMNVIIPPYMTNPTQDADLMKAISNYYEANINTSYE